MEKERMTVELVEQIGKKIRTLCVAEPDNISACGICDRIWNIFFKAGTSGMAYTGTGVHFKRADLADRFLGVDSAKRRSTVNSYHAVALLSVGNCFGTYLGDISL